MIIIIIIIIIINILNVTHKVIHYNWTEQLPTYLIWGLLTNQLRL